MSKFLQQLSARALLGLLMSAHDDPCLAVSCRIRHQVGRGLSSRRHCRSVSPLTSDETCVALITLRLPNLSPSLPSWRVVQTAPTSPRILHFLKSSFIRCLRTDTNRILRGKSNRKECELVQNHESRCPVSVRQLRMLLVFCSERKAPWGNLF